MIGTEVEQRQIVKAVGTRQHDEQHRHVDSYPLVGFRYEPEHRLRFPSHHQSTCQQHNILQERLHVAKFHGIAETSAVGDGIGYGQPQRHHRHHDHEDHCHTRCYTPLYSEQ